MALSAPNFHGLDIPVYGPETTVATRFNFEIAAAVAEGADFVRPAVISIDPGQHDTLKNLLDTTDRELAEVAECCGIIVVRHQFGLFRLTEENIKKYGHYITRLPEPFIPKNHILVAEVEVVPEPVSVDDLTDWQLREDLESYISGKIRSYINDRNYGLSDIYPHQVLVPRGHTTTPNLDELILCDIEPRFDHFKK